MKYSPVDELGIFETAFGRGAKVGEVGVNWRGVAFFAGLYLLALVITARAGPTDDRSAMLRGLAGRAGHVLGAASACPGITRSRIDALAAKISEVIRSWAVSGNDGSSIVALFSDGELQGSRAVLSKQTDCVLAEHQLADLENASAPSQLPIPQRAPSLPTPAVAPVSPPAAVPASMTQTAAFAGSTIASAVRGITANEIRFGAAMPLSGPNKDYGQQIRLGIETAFRLANDAGGVNGRMLRFIASDDGYEPARTPDAMKRLYEKEQVFGFIGNFGTPTAQISLPFALDHQMLSFASYSGANLLRRDPPDHFVFNYRPSYAEETEAAVRYLIRIRRLKPEQIAVFAQQDGYGDAGYQGAAKAMRALRGEEAGAILRLGYVRNTMDVDGAVAQLKASKIPIKAVVMQATYRPAAKFVEKTHDAYPGLIYTNPSTVGAIAFRDELMLLGAKYSAGVIVTQVVPDADGYSSLVIQYKSALNKYSGGESPDYISLEYFVAAQVLVEAVRRSGSQLDTEKLIETLENMRDLDLGLGAPISFGKSEHQGSHKIWGTQLKENGKYEGVELQ